MTSPTKSLEKWATWQEIHRQPEIWKSWGQTLDVAGLREWIAGLGIEEVWFCGAGTSAYIGDIVVAGLEGKDLGLRFRSVPTTDLVSRPQAYLNGANPLVVSFGRSGNSAETIGTLDALDGLAPEAPRLHITCNKKSALATRDSKGPLKVIVLPDETHDAGFAMTSSFSTMLFTSLALFDAPADVSARLNDLGDQLAELLPAFAKVPPRPERVVYVGSGSLAFAAREAALKVMELSAGDIPALWDSSLGFRHGPKSFVTDGTLINVFVSPEEPARSYDLDLVSELRVQFPNATVQAIGAGAECDIKMPYGAVWSASICVASSQIAGVLWAEELGLNVDDPFTGRGTLSRVVEGVKLYPVAS
ncbi:SIS domain-containing protein [Halocynthiibacter sp. C4]|uniref:SIS domain-containing protein n=1 Tax=Halocynthiibacter sp. C4 TaxID=2992758 RepID=UPI00237B2F92|nr:SIS domain-containing protein [Halocynthiibacter sp. C4]MDE0589171.1 SIS domain-containing protein [Halocynthiibacter sp. C4]